MKELTQSDITRMEMTMESLLKTPPDHTIHGLDLCGSLRELDSAEWPFRKPCTSRARMFAADTLDIRGAVTDGRVVSSQRPGM